MFTRQLRRFSSLLALGLVLAGPRAAPAQTPFVPSPEMVCAIMANAAFVECTGGSYWDQQQCLWQGLFSYLSCAP